MTVLRWWAGLSVGQTIGGPARSTALLAPRGQDLGGQDVGDGPADFQLNKTAAAAPPGCRRSRSCRAGWP